MDILSTPVKIGSEEFTANTRHFERDGIVSAIRCQPGELVQPWLALVDISGPSTPASAFIAPLIAVPLPSRYLRAWQALQARP